MHKGPHQHLVPMSHSQLNRKRWDRQQGKYTVRRQKAHVQLYTEKASWHNCQLIRLFFLDWIIERIVCLHWKRQEQWRDLLLKWGPQRSSTPWKASSMSIARPQRSSWFISSKKTIYSVSLHAVNKLWWFLQSSEPSTLWRYCLYCVPSRFSLTLRFHQLLLQFSTWSLFFFKMTS